jgi:hypothetical protein
MATSYLHEQDIQVSRGLIRGATVRNIFGYNTAITTAFIPAWEFASVYAYPGSAITMTVTSASGSDDGKTLLIQGLDANYAEISDVVTINGAGDINTNKPFFRINDVILNFRYNQCRINYNSKHRQNCKLCRY